MALQCEKCVFIANSSPSLKQHQITHHSEIKYWKCDFPGCTYSTKSKSHLDIHFRLHDPNPEVRKPYACKFENCGYRAAQNGSLTRHVQIRHTPEMLRKFRCSLCASRFASEWLLRAHIPQHLKEKMYKCDSCNFSTHTKMGLRLHVQALHETSVTFKCSAPGCNYSTTYRPRLKDHLKIHEPDPLKKRPVPCNFSNCTFRAYNSGHMKLHVEHKHNPERKKEHFCPLCSKAFYTRYVVRSHIRSVHTREKTFCCEKCSFRTYRSNKLKTHYMLVHEREGARVKKFKCEFCDYRTDSRYHLDLHQKSIHSSERKLQCDASGCQFKTNFPTALRNHMLIHETEPERRFPFACPFPECDFRRRLRQKLKTHVQNHKSSRRKLKCPSCPNKYPDFISLNFHKDLIHEKICYRCPKCNYNARYKRNLDYHLSNQCWSGSTSEQQVTGVANFVTKSHLWEINNDGKFRSVCNSQNDVANTSLLARVARECRVPIVILRKICIKIV